MTIATATKVLPIRSKPQAPMPPLASGDRLTRADYIERYRAMPSQIKAERIEGTVYMAPAALSAGFHGRPHLHMTTWLGYYEAATPGVAAADNSTLHLDPDNDPQPDLCLFILPSHGGRVKMDAEGYVYGAPELIVEIAASSASYDLGVKQSVFRRNGVKEYVVFRTYDGEIDWFVLRDSEYQKLLPNAEGVYVSEAFPGLRLAAQAMIEGKLADVLNVLQKGLAGNDHAVFAKSLQLQVE